jgi:hypothetical protein
MWFVSRWLQNVTNFGEFDSCSFTCTHPLGTITNQRWTKMLWSVLQPMKHLCFLSLHHRGLASLTVVHSRAHIHLGLSRIKDEPKCYGQCYDQWNTFASFLYTIEVWRVWQSFIHVHTPTRDCHESKMSQNVMVSVTTNETPLLPFSAQSKQNIYIPKVVVCSKKTPEAFSFTKISMIEGWYRSSCKNICTSSTHKEQLDFPRYN